MAILLPDLLADPALGLVLEDGSEPPAQPVQWVAVTELEDPRPFLSGAEVVLSTGVRLRSTASQRAFVHRVHEAGALALGFGVGLTHSAVPTALLAEARAVDLPVFRVPYEVPFIAIGKKVADALSAATYSGLEDLLEGHAVLASALLGPGGLGSLLAELARMLGTDVVLHQYGARLAGVSPDPGYRTAPPPQGTTAWHRLPIATGLKDRCTLDIAEPYTHAAVVEYAQSLISVELTNQARNRTGIRSAHGQLLQDVVRGSLAGPAAAVRLAGSGVDTTQRHSVLIIEVASGQRRALRTLPLPDGWAGVSAGLVEDHLVLVLPVTATPAQGSSAQASSQQPSYDPGSPDHVSSGPPSPDPTELSRYLHGAGLTARLGVGGAYPHPNGLRWSYFEARDALQRGQAVNRADRLSLTSLLLGSADVPLADLATETLAPLEDFDEAHGSTLLPTLQQYLELDGSVAAVAAALGLHRNTVRYRLQQVVALTGYDPAVTADRVHLYLALRVRALG